MRKGSAKAYPEAVEGADFYRQACDAEWLKAEDPMLHQKVLQAAITAERLPAQVLEHLHGTARAGTTPDLLTLAGQLRANRAVADEISRKHG